jgi:CPA2 family monovalent cation:H+ antiporter-2
MIDLISLFKQITTPYGGLESHHILPDVLTILSFAIIVVLIFKKLKLSPVIGYIVAGALIGPYGFNIAGYNDVTKSLAEFGVVFLLFMIGLEITLERLFAMKKMIFGIGSLQLIVTGTIFGIISYNITNNLALSLVIGLGLSLSSTAIVLKILGETYQANTKAGKISLAILLLQDLAVVPLFVLIPLLNKSGVGIFEASVAIIVKSFITLTTIIVFGRYLLKPLLHIIASQKYNDLFIASTLFVVLSAAWVTNYTGLSLGLGAFIAGVMIAETEFQPQVKSTIEPFKGLFLGFFFITEIGMQFDLSLVADHYLYIIIFTIFLIITKTLITLLICLCFKNQLSISVNTALLVSQTGEFAFVIFELARKQSILTDEIFQNISLIVGLSMAITPLLANAGKKLEDYISKKKIPNNKVEIPCLHNLVIIIGYGRVGRTIGKILDKENIKFISIDKNNSIVSKYFSKHNPVYYGDITSTKMLLSLPLENAAAIVLTMKDKIEVMKSIKILKKHYPNINLITRAQDLSHYNEIKTLHNNQFIIPEIPETGVQISKQILLLMGEDEEKINNILVEFRYSEWES